jgi:ERCC4-related helicase
MLSAPAKLILRAYQHRIVQTIMQENTIVLLPTGSGKTLIAAEAIAQTFAQSKNARAVMFVPTIALVAQQARALREWLGSACRVGEFHGEKTLPLVFDVLVSTPKAFESAQKRGTDICAWDKFSLIVFDEVHHVIKDHPYRTHRLSRSNNTPRVVGLTASLTYAVGADKVRNASQELCRELRISKIEVASEAELRLGGYRGATAGSVAEVRTKQSHSSPTLRGEVIPIVDRRPHLMHSMFFQRNRNATATATSHQLMRCTQTSDRPLSPHP